MDEKRQRLPLARAEVEKLQEEYNNKEAEIKAIKLERKLKVDIDYMKKLLKEKRTKYNEQAIDKARAYFDAVEKRVKLNNELIRIDDALERAKNEVADLERALGVQHELMYKPMTEEDLGHILSLKTRDMFEDKGMVKFKTTYLLPASEIEKHRKGEKYNVSMKELMNTELILPTKGLSDTYVLRITREGVSITFSTYRHSFDDILERATNYLIG